MEICGLGSTAQDKMARGSLQAVEVDVDVGVGSKELSRLTQAFLAAAEGRHLCCGLRVIWHGRFSGSKSVGIRVRFRLSRSIKSVRGQMPSYGFRSEDASLYSLAGEREKTYPCVQILACLVKMHGRHLHSLSVCPFVDMQLLGQRFVVQGCCAPAWHLRWMRLQEGHGGRLHQGGFPIRTLNLNWTTC